MWTNNKLKLGLILAKKIDNYFDCSRTLMKQKLKTKFWPYEGHVSARKEEKKKTMQHLFQSQEQEEKPRRKQESSQEQGYSKEIAQLS